MILWKFASFFLILLLPLISYSAEIDRPVILMFGTRPEAIKVLPLYKSLKEEGIPTVLCSTGQHRDLLEEIFTSFDVQPDYDFKLMKSSQGLSYITEKVLHETTALCNKIRPRLVVVQGDTSSAMAAALAAFYLHIPVAHIEAGLRTGNLQGPFPEELNRRAISLLASLHFAPTASAASNLLQEGIDKNTIFCTGNTIVDALYFMKEKLELGNILPSKHLISILNEPQIRDKHLLLLTAHRRESFNGGLECIFQAVKEALHSIPNIFIIYPSHPNPIVQKSLMESGLYDEPNIAIIPPIPYQDMVYLLCSVQGILTDSGGIQEEALSLGKPVLVLRNETDRIEGIEEGIALIVGTKKEAILSGIHLMTENLSNEQDYKQDLYGDGKASKRMTKIIQTYLEMQSP